MEYRRGRITPEYCRWGEAQILHLLQVWDQADAKQRGRDRCRSRSTPRLDTVLRPSGELAGDESRTLRGVQVLYPRNASLSPSAASKREGSLGRRSDQNLGIWRSA